MPPPRRPSARVIRRRRQVALAAAGLLVALVVGLLSLGGGTSDGRAITALLTTGAAQPATLCDHLSAAMLEAAGGHDACVSASPERAPAGSVQDVTVDGDSATAVVVRDSGSERISLVREDGDWKVDDVR